MIERAAASNPGEEGEGGGVPPLRQDLTLPNVRSLDQSTNRSFDVSDDRLNERSNDESNGQLNKRSNNQTVDGTSNVFESVVKMAENNVRLA